MKAVEIRSIGLCGDKRKLLVIIRNYRAALKTKPTNKKPLAPYVQNKTTKKFKSIRHQVLQTDWSHIQ